MKRVLVVDDDFDIQLLLRLELEAEGYEVETADNGRMALELIPVLQPDVVLLDVMMPEIDGWGVLQRLAEPKPPIIVVSGLATDRNSHYAYAVELGALGFISKPFDPEDLLEIVASASALKPGEIDAFRAELLARLQTD